MLSKKVIPLIIVGRQRAGTRYITNILNSFQEVIIQGEIPNPVMKSVSCMINEIESYYLQQLVNIKTRNRGIKEYNNWLSQRQDLIFSIWANCGQEKRIEINGYCKYYGYKRPNNEFYFDLYENIFTYNPPIYVYCIRNFKDNFLSIVSRWPDRSLKKIAQEYLDSIIQFKKMKQISTDRALVFNLDKLIDEGFNYVKEAIILPLNLNLSESLEVRLKQMGAINTTEGDHNLVRRKTLTDEEECFISKHPELETEYQQFL